MAERVFLHIGLPKTGTTYLQSILWGAHDQLTRDGVLLPGRHHRQHLWAALDLQGRQGLEKRSPKAPGTWARLVKQARKWKGPVVFSHEFFCAADAGDVERAVEMLAPAEVHVVVTARDSLGMLLAGWQEYVKNGGQESLAEVHAAVRPRQGGAEEFSWRTWDLEGVLERWSTAIPPERVHVVPLPGPGAPPEQLWIEFAGVLGLDPASYPTPEEAKNTSLGVVQVELLRRINGELKDFRTALDRGEWIRGYLGENQLARQRSERFGANEQITADCRSRADRAVALIEARGFRVHGDVDRLRVPDDLPARPEPGAVTDGQLVEAAAALVAGMLGDVRSLTTGSDVEPRH